MNQFIAATGFGVVSAAVIALAAVGFTVQFSVTNILNIAYGSQLVVGSFVAYVFNDIFGWNLWLALVVTGLIGGLGSVMLNRGIIGPFLRHGTTFFGLVVITIGLNLVIEYSIEAISGPSFFHYHIANSGVVKLGALLLTWSQIVVLIIGLACMLVIHLLLRYTRVGKAMRATSANPALARGCGIATDRITDIGWFISGVLAGLAGVLFGLSLDSFSFTLGDQYLLVIIAAAVLGGIGHPYGAMIGALIIGLISQWSSLVISSAYSNVSAFAVLVLVLVFRPSGILPGIARVREMVG